MNSLLDFLSNGLLRFSWWQIVLFTLAVTHVTIVGVTVYLHRCQAHRALDLHPIMSHFFRAWLWMTTGMLTGQWAAIHRKHHAKCETEEDPHSPQTRGIWKVLLEGAELYRAEAKNEETMRKYGHGTPNDWLERNVYSKYPILGVSLMMVIDVALFGLVGLTVWAVQMVWIPFWAAGVVNGLGHFWGYRNFNAADASTNLFPWGIVIGGEELHNNHHTFATSAKLSNKWYEFDIGWMYIRIMSAFGLAKVKKIAPTPRLAARKTVLDQETLQAVLSNRYEVMARYAKTLKRAYRQELAHLKELGAREKYQLMRGARKWFHKDEAGLDEPQKRMLPEIFANSQKLHTFFQLRAELTAIWERSNASREQLLTQLQDWCHRAEQSGIKALQEFATRLRRYA
ncbi:fatty acid desaturase family protein [Burkholderia pseudomallei MSHR5613]|uniref:Fatty acid desaturase family protein n=2 Tax=Burkholderia pseudomallei TaxID=28450 RepID=Q3JV61_BURP1|nr:fatty acid desaturase family protein [Burkholderia pseudomallei 1710b]ABO05715.1 fatty acid desaturase family protein [Burkholderia mallei NCTC 10247]AFI67221.1 fatty acid desaturase family protein [Burkholderia pseudomallei 1026b]EIF63249.1 fatty acid desaturase family protein [Burkholderia pseudomallei 1258a]EIF64721.1 fatty acid desaturase family protein [Burkholderia pseudomallei 1258b]EIF65288.1 fatty acid desaturase family protein [Burkholderia pseudomallei 1026a]EIF75914.1 fatty aci